VRARRELALTLTLSRKRKTGNSVRLRWAKKTAVPKDGGRIPNKPVPDGQPYWQTVTWKLSMMSPFGAEAAVFESLVMR